MEIALTLNCVLLGKSRSFTIKLQLIKVSSSCKCLPPLMRLIGKTFARPNDWLKSLHRSSDKIVTRKQAKNYTTDNELKMINNQMYAINVTFGNDTPASDKDVYIGQSPVAMHLIYEYFISGTMDYEQFMMDFKNKSLEIVNALAIILEDVNKDRDENDKIKFFVLGIDELNALHSLYDKNLNPKSSPFNCTCYWGLNCSGEEVFHVSVLAGMIQGPLEQILTYLRLPLPLRLLWNEEPTTNWMSILLKITN
ncbi:hypothetical protein C1646_662133 [Rhizophagus diaphanus]|nr:hypothetical protein C1646_662133 [Rhizophagus diaphanus] [Rhizophagus sp. MUCL 43196]